MCKWMWMMSLNTPPPPFFSTHCGCSYSIQCCHLVARLVTSVFRSMIAHNVRVIDLLVTKIPVYVSTYSSFFSIFYQWLATFCWSLLSSNQQMCHAIIPEIRSSNNTKRSAHLPSRDRAKMFLYKCCTNYIACWSCFRFRYTIQSFWLN